MDIWYTVPLQHIQQCGCESRQDGVQQKRLSDYLV